MNRRFLTFMIILNFAVFRDLLNLEVNLNFITPFIALVKFNFNYFVIFEFHFFDLKS
jgi:negative regulator of genetic competence, sporulation and motility